jgi:hypothetical protein
MSENSVQRSSQRSCCVDIVWKFSATIIAAVGAMVSRTLDQSISDSDHTVQIAIASASHAMELAQFLAAHSIRLSNVDYSESDARAAAILGFMTYFVLLNHLAIATAIR